MVAMSDPTENMVYTYDLTEGLYVNHDSKAIIACAKCDTGTFGRRLALAASGKSIAVVSWDSTKESSTTGKICIYIGEENL